MQAFVLLLCSPAFGQEVWALGEVHNLGVEPNAADAFRELLRDEIVRQRGVRFVDVAAACGDVQCVQNASVGTGAVVAVHASVRRLGAKIVASASAVQVVSGQPAGSSQVSVEKVEELDAAARQIASALAAGESEEPTSSAEPAPPEDRTRVAFGMNLDIIAPLEGYAGMIGGAGIDLGVWVETAEVAFYPRTGYRFGINDMDDNFHHIPIEVGFYWLPIQGNFTPVLGGGVGAHFMHEEMNQTQTTLFDGGAYQESVNMRVEDNVLGGSLFVSAGVLVFRSQIARVFATINYAVTMAGFTNSSTEQALRFEIGLLLGGR